MKNDVSIPSHGEAKLHLARLLSSAVACDRCVVYDVDGDLMPGGHVAHDGDTRWIGPYGHFHTIDPMRPELYAKSESNVIVTGWNFAPERLYRTAYYEGFMRRLGQRHKAELFFRSRSGRLIAGARLSRRSDLGAFGDKEVSMLRLLQPVLESHINQVSAHGIRDRSGPFARLTVREWEVVRLAADGLSNKAICERLGTGLPTVKSQMASAFRKLSLRNRSELITICFSARPDAAR
jgi:DNA-binding CsgD family transcriptional regulator